MEETQKAELTVAYQQVDFERDKKNSQKREADLHQAIHATGIPMDQAKAYRRTSSPFFGKRTSDGRHIFDKAKKAEAKMFQRAVTKLKSFPQSMSEGSYPEPVHPKIKAALERRRSTLNAIKLATGRDVTHYRSHSPLKGRRLKGMALDGPIDYVSDAGVEHFPGRAAETEKFQRAVGKLKALRKK